MSWTRWPATWRSARRRPAQYAAVAAFDAYDECDGARARGTRTNRGLLLNGLRRLGIDRLAPADGAFYVYADIGT